MWHGGFLAWTVGPALGLSVPAMAEAMLTGLQALHRHCVLVLPNNQPSEQQPSSFEILRYSTYMLLQDILALAFILGSSLVSE
jgi:hypothetical protein